MALNDVEYHRPKQLEDALALLARRGVRTVPIGGGSQLIAEDRRDVDAVVDLSELYLSYIRRDGDSLRVGATTTLQTLIDSPESARAWGGELARAIDHTAARNLREQGTLAGTLMSAESNNPLAVMLLALDASLTIVAGDSSHLPAIPLDELLSSLATRHSSLITEIVIPLPRPGDAERAAFERVGRTPHDQPIVCAAVKARIDSGTMRDVRIALGGVAARPMRAARTERALEGRSDMAAVSQIAGEIDPPSDFVGGAEYRREMAVLLVRRGLERVRRDMAGGRG